MVLAGLRKTPELRGVTLNVSSKISLPSAWPALAPSNAEAILSRLTRL